MRSRPRNNRIKVPFFVYSAKRFPFPHFLTHTTHVTSHSYWRSKLPHIWMRSLFPSTNLKDDLKGLRTQWIPRTRQQTRHQERTSTKMIRSLTTMSLFIQSASSGKRSMQEVQHKARRVAHPLMEQQAQRQCQEQEEQQEERARDSILTPFVVTCWTLISRRSAPSPCPTWTSMLALSVESTFKVWWLAGSHIRRCAHKVIKGHWAETVGE